eukprot:scaffold17839_cov72-Cyclotella_meneghiniana.AAC.13
MVSHVNDGGTWLSAAFLAIKQSSHLNDDLYGILRAFGKDDKDAPGPASLDPDAVDDNATVKNVGAITYLKDRISTELLSEVDPDQALMFSRRFVSVSSLLEGDNSGDDRVTTKQLLRLALHRRTVQILSTTDPIVSKRKALRIRALVDFIWSVSLVLELKDSPDNKQYPTLAELSHERGQQSSCNEFAPGFYHSTIEGLTSDFGPVHINILRINTSTVRMKCIDAREITTDLPTLAKEMGAVAAISGGFFLYSEPDIQLPSKRTDPVGLLVSDGEIEGPPVFQRSAIIQSRQNNGKRTIGLSKIGMAGTTCYCSWEGQNTPLELTIGSSMSYDEAADIAFHAHCVHRADFERAVVRKGQCAFAIVGKRVVERVMSPECQEEIHVPLAGFVLLFSEEACSGTKIMNDDDVEINVSYALPLPIENAMAGGPMFFSDDDGHDSIDLSSEDFKGSAPPITFSQDETHDHNLLPRMGIGIAKCSISGDEQLVCAAIDGRNLDRALGLTLKGTSDLLRSLGCYKAMNLDGGSSKRMVIRDQNEFKVVCLSTTEIKANNASNSNDKTSANPAIEPSRPVHSAILFCSEA